ncbi:MAG: transglycosylase domain-containing protein [Leptospiraceae bacterium]|nr:transglycosylase domain-containing protein [Leptospiraceae bacterium]MDW7976030.1 transglycosylase domain-containing protein [Leptospiraceae bacterium]
MIDSRPSQVDPLYNKFQNKNFLERVFFAFLATYFRRFLQKEAYLRNSILLIVVLVFLIPLLVAFSFADPFLVWFVEDYEKPSIIYGYNSKGEVVPIAEFYSQNRKIIELTEDDFENLNVVKTFIAAEDIRFREHFGIDIPGIIRALIINLIAGEIKEGASTLTQQTARLRFLSRERTIIRKLREVSLSFFLELKYPKYKILEIYFNEVPLGHGTLGIESASQFYFNKNFRELTIGEASVLSSLTTSPNNYSPLKNPMKSISKMQVTFKRLVENGEISIRDAEREYKNIVQNYILTLNRYPDESSFTKRLDLFPYASNYVLTLLPSEIKNNLNTGGYRIYTTLNVEKQIAAEKALQGWLKQLNEIRNPHRKPFTQYEIFDERYQEIYPLLKQLFGIADFKFRISKKQRDFEQKYLKENKEDLILLNYLFGERNIVNALENKLKESIDTQTLKPEIIEGALISINPNNGKIEAVVGGSKFIPANQLLRFLSKRQPGSALKPLIYASAMEYSYRNPEDKERNFTAATVLDDSPITFIDSDLSEYEPDNFGGTFQGPMRIREALVQSKNTIAVQSYIKMGPDVINGYLEKLLQLPKGKLPREAAIALGSYDVSPLQLATAYTVFPRNGSMITPFFIEKITVEKNKEVKLVYQAPPPEVINIFSPETMFILKDILKEAVQKGTGRAAYIPNVPVYGKTGTSNRFTNAWFVGMTPDSVTVIYIGYDNNKSLGQGSTGGSLAAPVWRNFFVNYINQTKFPKYENEPIPNNVIKKSVCSLTGKNPTKHCDTIEEYFIIGTEPKEICEVHSSNLKEMKNPITEIPKLDLKIELE